jgi:hypothetical protein
VAQTAAPGMALPTAAQAPAMTVALTAEPAADSH